MPDQQGQEQQRNAGPGQAGARPVQPYLFFEGRAEEALEFYRRAIGAEVDVLMRFRDSPEPAACVGGPAAADKVMHACFRVCGTSIMASDGANSGMPAFGGFALSLPAPDVPTAERLFAALAEGGAVRMPLAPTFWSPAFGLLTDRFGVPWMVNVDPA